MHNKANLGFQLGNSTIHVHKKPNQTQSMTKRTHPQRLLAPRRDRNINERLDELVELGAKPSAVDDLRVAIG